MLNCYNNKTNLDTPYNKVKEVYCNMFTIYMHRTPSGKVYVGQTRIKPDRRWLGGKGYRGNVYFTNAINKYGWNNIEHIILDTVQTQEEADTLEKAYILQFKSNDPDFGYNFAVGGVGGVCPHTDEWNGKISKSNKLWYEQHPEYRQLISERMSGNSPTPETRQKMSKAARNRVRLPHTEETKRKISNSNKGKKLPRHVIEKLRQNRLGKKQSDETRLKRSKSMTGRILSEETKNKLRETWKRTRQSRVGWKHTPENIEKIRQASTGVQFTQERKNKISSSLKGKPKTDAHRQKLQKINKGRVWINDTQNSKMVYPHELSNYLCNGWNVGRLRSKKEE